MIIEYRYQEIFGSMNNTEFIELEDAHPVTGSVILCTLPETLKTQLENKINFILKNKIAIKSSTISDTLAGQIEDQIRFTDDGSLFEFTKQLAKEYFFPAKPSEVTKQLAWINLQKKTEYNPNHIHDGNLSYVIYIKIPYLCENEDSVSNTIKSPAHLNGRFQFTYITNKLTTNVYILDADKSFEGKMIMFKSSLRHCVYPFFTSDGYRISLAGNIWVK